MTRIYLAYAKIPPCKRDDFNSTSAPPSLLLSYFYLPGLFTETAKLKLRSWCLDSGAFSAKARGRPIKNDDFIAFIRRDLPKSPIGPPEAIFALDVIGDWKASVKNCEQAWANDIQAVPTWHYGEPFDVLKGLAKDYPKIAIGGISRGSPKAKSELIQRCFHAIWPKLVHGFGVTVDHVLNHNPLDSTDSTTWSNPYRYGYYPKASGGSARMRTTYAQAKARPEIEYYLARERELEHRWGLQLAPLRRMYREIIKPTPYQAVPMG